MDCFFFFFLKVAERTLDAPKITDDCYLNLLDWSTSNVIAIGLGNSIYLWDVDPGSAIHLVGECG